MPILTKQEKYLVYILTSTALVGSVIGLVRHNWLKNPEILISPKKLPAYIQKVHEQEIITKHKLAVNNQVSNNKLVANVIENKFDENKVVDQSKVISKKSKKSVNISREKKTTQKTIKIININSASKEDFITLPHIGEVKASRIIQYRAETGGFSSINELQNVKGIGPKTLKKLEPYLTIK